MDYGQIWKYLYLLCSQNIPKLGNWPNAISMQRDFKSQSVTHLNILNQGDRGRKKKKKKRPCALNAGKLGQSFSFETSGNQPEVGRQVLVFLLLFGAMFPTHEHSVCRRMEV